MFASIRTLSSLRQMGLGLSAALLSLACATSAVAQPNVVRDPNDPGGTKAANAAAHNAEGVRADTRFLKEAAQAGLAEIEAAKLAIGKSTNPQVKAYAEHIVNDHTKANGELSQLASTKGVTLPTEPSLADKAKLKVLALREGKSFDEHYAKTFGVDAHEDAIKLFKKGASEGADAEVKAFANKTLPTLTEHLESAKSLKTQTEQANK